MFRDCPFGDGSSCMAVPSSPSLSFQRQGENFFENRDNPFPSPMLVKHNESAERVKRKAEAVKGRMKQVG